MWDELLDIEEEFEVLEKPPERMPKIRTPEFLAARKRRIVWLREQIEGGNYWRPAELIAEGILFGRPRWGESLIDEEGRRLDELG